MNRVGAWARRRTEAEWVALAAGVAVFGYVAWDEALWDARMQLALHLIAIGVLLGLAAYAARGGSLPRTPLDIPILGLLAALALATVSAANVGMSLRAVAATVATAAMLPVAIIAIRARPTWVALVIAVPVLLYAVPSLVSLLARRAEWFLVGAPGLPPLRMISEGTPFGSVAVPPFVLLATWAVTGIVDDGRVRFVLRTGLLIVGVPLAILSGSRSAWLALGVVAVIELAPWAWRRRGELRPTGTISLRVIAIGLVALAVGAVVVALVVPRLTAVTSLLYRGALWRDTLTAWSSDPLLGLGPGIMPYARQAAAPDFSFPVRQPHSHNLALGVLGDAGIVGLVAALVMVGAFLVVAGPWRARTARGRTAAAVLLGLGVAGLFEDLTFLPAFNLLVVALVAIALLEADAVRWWRPRALPRTAGLAALGLGGAGAAVLLAAMMANDAGGIAYRAGLDAGSRGDWEVATERFERAVALDPWHPASPRALAVAADAADRPELAVEAARDATLLNPGDATAWTNLALSCGRVGDLACQQTAARETVVTARYLAPELLNSALVLDALGEVDAADEAFRLSLLTQPITSFVVDWPRKVSIGDGTLPDVTDPSWELNLLLARRDMGEPLAPADYTDPAVRALAHALEGDGAEARDWIARGIAEHRDDIRTWDIAIVLGSAWGDDVSREIAIASVLRGGPYPARDREPRVPGRVFDIAGFRAYPRDGFVSGAIRLHTRPPFPWILERLVPSEDPPAADAG